MKFDDIRKKYEEIQENKDKNVTLSVRFKDGKNGGIMTDKIIMKYDDRNIDDDYYKITETYEMNNKGIVTKLSKKKTDGYYCDCIYYEITEYNSNEKVKKQIYEEKATDYMFNDTTDYYANGKKKRHKRDEWNKYDDNLYFEENYNKKGSIIAKKEITEDKEEGVVTEKEIIYNEEGKIIKRCIQENSMEGYTLKENIDEMTDAEIGKVINAKANAINSIVETMMEQQEIINKQNKDIEELEELLSLKKILSDD